MHVCVHAYILSRAQKLKVNFAFAKLVKSNYS